MEKFKENQEYKIGEQVPAETAKTLEEQFHELLRDYNNENELALRAVIKDPEKRKQSLEKSGRFVKQGLSYEFAIVIGGFKDEERAFLQDANHPEQYEALSDPEKQRVEKLRKKLKKALGEAAQRFNLNQDELYKMPWETVEEKKPQNSVSTGHNPHVRKQPLIMRGE